MVEQLGAFTAEVTRVAREVGTEGKLGGQAQVKGVSGTWKDLTESVNLMAANLTTQVRAIADVSTAVTKGDLSRSIAVEAAGEVALLKDNVNEMIRNLKTTTTKNTEQDWLKSNLATFTRKLQGQRDLQQVCKMTLSELAPLVGAQHGVFYLNEPQQDEALLKLLASYAFRERKHLASQFKPGEGLIGQCILEKERILLTHVPADYVQIGSGLGEATPANLVVLPVIFEGVVKAVIELASFQQFSEIHLSFLDQLMESLGIVINTIQTNMRTEELLKQSQSLTKELQSQQEELQQTNEELEEKARLLGEQKLEVERKNREVEDARISLEEKAAQLALTSKYKSEFLANMSHELRTPLNSLLILSQQLEENAEQNLTERQVKFAHTIRGAGSDLLNLINDILDLSKIESGTTTIEAGVVALADVVEGTERTFRQLADQKGLEFNLEIAPECPLVIRTDRKRLEQVLKNLLSNAFKFTEQGKVELKLNLATGGWSADHKHLGQARSILAFSVSDTGVGIPAEKRRIIFEAFQQADGGTARNYGGTGLGLAISREIAVLLGGELKLTASQLGAGSTFTLYLPLDCRPPQPAPGSEPDAAPVGRVPARRGPTPGQGGRPTTAGPSPQSPIANLKPKIHEDDRENIAPGDRVLLIVEDDPKFAAVLLDTAHEKGFKGVIAAGGERALALARQFVFSAITLDIRLPDVDGWTVLDRLKLDPNTRHIPVHVISVELDTRHGLEHGAIACVTKPVTKETLDGAFEKIQAFVEQRVRHLLVVEDNSTERESIVELIGNGDVIITAVGTGAEALKALASEHYDCMVLDLLLPDMSGFKVLEEMKKHPELCQMPVVINTAKELSKKEEAQLRQMAETIVVKGVHSPERLLDETALFLHRVSANLPEAKRQILHKLHHSDAILEGKTVLVVDDDVRNLFALTTVLEAHKMKLVTAENGKDALKLLEQTPQVDVVLMDIMMPEMDGYETMRNIRKQPNFKALPIIALTAKAMKGDREKCIESGANDYIAKPVNADQLLSLLRVWLYR
jgi:CheY-like chemotaxis protein/signal transduction histidine kinase/HAMP domain-containing protein